MAERKGFRNLGGALNRRALLWLAIAVVVLIVADVVLVAIAVGRTAPADHGTPGPVPTYTSDPSAAGTPAPTPVPAPTSSSFPGAAGGPTDAVSAGSIRYLSVIDDDTAWRATAGTCDGPDAVVERTEDGGSTWKAVDFGKFDVHSVAAIAAGDTKTSVLAGVGTSCESTPIASFTGGQFWAADTTSSPAAITTSGLQLADGVVAAPCAAPLHVVQGDTATAVACADELDWRRGTGPWVTVPLAGLRAFAVSGDTYTLARVGRASCDGVAIETLPAAGVTAQSVPTKVGCASVTDAGGAVGLDRDGDSVWLWSGDQVLVSKDGGVTW